MTITSLLHAARFRFGRFSKPKRDRSLSELWQSIRDGNSESELLINNLNYWSAREPYSGQGGVVGAIDYARLKSGKTLLLRGWIFALAGITRALYLKTGGADGDWQLVLAEGLSRNDVIANFPFVPHAADCGFVMAIPSLEIDIGNEITIEFRQELMSGEVKEGTFMPVEITPALSK